MTATVVAAAWAAWVLWCTAGRRPPRSLGAAPRRAGPWARWLGAIAAAVAAGALAGPWALGALAVVVAGGLVLHRRRRERRAAQRARACVPDLGELLRVAVAAGLTPVLALEQAADLAPGPGRAAAGAVLAATARGRPLGDALAVLVERLGPTVRPLVDALAATERYGVPLEPVLEAAVVDLRRRRRTDAQAAARRLPVTLSFPLVGCVLPAFALLTLAPLVAGAFDAIDVRPSAAPAPIGPPGPPPPDASGGRRHAPRTDTARRVQPDPDR